MDNQIKKLERETYKLLNNVETLIGNIVQLRHENTKFKKYLNINKEFNSKYKDLISKNHTIIKKNTDSIKKIISKATENIDTIFKKLKKDNDLLSVNSMSDSMSDSMITTLAKFTKDKKRKFNAIEMDDSDIYFRFLTSKRGHRVDYQKYTATNLYNSTLDNRFEPSIHNYYIIEPYLLKDFEISRYLLQPMAEALSYIPDEHYILCPLYQPEKLNDPYDSYEWSDFQLGFTGTLTEDEVKDGVPDYKKGFERELGEELGLKLTDSTVIQEFPVTKCNNYHASKLIKMYNIDLKYLENNTIRTTPSKSDDDKKYKIGGFIHSNFINVLQYLDSNIILESNADKIVGIVAVKALFAKQKYSEKFNIQYEFVPTPPPEVKRRKLTPEQPKRQTSVPSWMIKK